MIIKSRVTQQYALEVFENFRVDTSLPKYIKTTMPVAVNEGSSKAPWRSSVANSPDQSDDWEDGANITTPQIWVNNDGDMTVVDPNSKRRRFVRFMEKILRIQKPKKKELHGSVNPFEVLMSVCPSLQGLKDYKDRVEVYDKAIDQALKGGQTGRADNLKRARRLVQQESVLIVAGFKRIISEAQAIEFASKCQKGLRLDWVANFGRPIPDDVLAKKLEADKLKVFDNYVILHYDPQAKAFTLTDEQVRAKKDPILFGVIKDSRKLYYIGDWKDDKCDLTMEEVARVLGHETGEIPEDPTATM